jgi:hypothetical protein
MCFFNQPDTADPVLPPEPAQMKEPDKGATSQAGRRTQDRIRAGTQTVLTSGSGVTATAPTEKKTLLGQ